MNIKLRLALQFTLIVAGILLFFSALVYYFSYSSQLTKFRQSLLERAKDNATLFINVAEVDSSLLMKIHESTSSWENEELALTDSAFNIIYSYNSEILNDRGTLIYHKGNEVNYFNVRGKDGVSYRHTYNNHIYFVYVMAFDRSRFANLRELRKFLFWSIIFSICLSVLFSYFFARRAIRPISDIIRTVKEINSLKLNNRLNEGNKKDEIAQLAVTFNEMLSDLEVAFRNQEEFVSNASHELRTPLSVMIGESEYFLNRNRSLDEYQKQLSGLVIELKNMNSLINSLLELAQINRDRNVIFSDIRIDEVVFNAILKVKGKYVDRKILPKITYPESGNELIINGNEGLLEIAFTNILDNACKFSERDVSISFLIDEEKIVINIADEGIGIPDDEIEAINKPFKRASNVRFIGGYGIGLSLVTKIIEIHHARLNIFSKLNEGTRFEFSFSRA
ncbi:MAG TPA: HAMP domain-containing sensor histidine kinase [Bacteroidales bacterium]|jgi:signal transduction histidine kinase|nr:HAMP domain-containing sensor histidine kinase [Bacteroidales bacterium]